MKKVLLFLLISVLILALVGCGETETPEKVEQSSSEVEQEEVEQEDENIAEEEQEQETETKVKIFNIGDTVKIGDVGVTLNSTREDAGGDFLKPDDGNIYYIVNLTIQNNSDEAYNSSTIMQMSLADGEGYTYDITIGPDTKGSLDGEIGAGRKLRGEVAFEIPKDATGLEFIYDYNLITDGQIIFKLDR